VLNFRSPRDPMRLSPPEAGGPVPPHLPPRVGLGPIRLFLLSAILAGALPTSAKAQTTGDAVPYSLTELSYFSIGCFGPCLCAVVSFPFSGSFYLRQIDTGPLYTNYAVENLSGAFSRGGKMVRVTGGGRYRIGGEVALTHELQLDLVIGGDYPQSFDSGLVPGGSDFPAITITTPAHGFACYDTVIEFRAKPATAGIPEARPPGVIAVPNPFRAGVELRFASASPPPLEVAILDVHGRTVRSLDGGVWAMSAQHVMTWDGLASDGTAAPPGIYLARVRWPEREWTRRIVKLE